jgi:acyl-CoA synthetase (AMP-forming)/AMP-acid ligase II
MDKLYTWGDYNSMFDYFIKQFEKNSEKNAIIFEGKNYSYNFLIEEISHNISLLKSNKIEVGDVVALVGDFTPTTIAMLFALIDNKNIIVPLVRNQLKNFEDKINISNASKIIYINDENNISFELRNTQKTHEYFATLNRLSVSGLVLFTSGTSGFPKAAAHNFEKLLFKFSTPKIALRTLNFLLFDHWGGLNTMFHTLSNGGIVLALQSRSVTEVCNAIEKYEVELLPASPTLLNLLLISEEYNKYDLSSLKLITYGSEPMPESTLIKLKNTFPNIKLQQTYGLIELGVLRSKSKEDGSLWVKLGGEGFELRVVENMLEIKAESAMLGYINAISPFTHDGYFKTGDLVEVDGDYFKILGRKSELINVGGEKVYPQEVENCILQFPAVLDVTVFAEKNGLVGNIVCANVYIQELNDENLLINEIKKYCKSKLASFKVPVKIKLQNEPLYNDRFKKQRN